MDLGECRKERWRTRGRRVAQLAEECGRRRAGDSGGGGERRAGEAERGERVFYVPHTHSKTRGVVGAITKGEVGSGGIWQRSSASHMEW